MLSSKSTYLHIALNGTLSSAQQIILSLPPSDRIIIEVGTPLIKQYGMDAIRQIKGLWSMHLARAGLPAYVVADMKTMDRAEAEVAMCRQAGADGVIALGLAPVETVNTFIDTCAKLGMDSFVDMMNVPEPIKLLRQYKKPPNVVFLHRGADEEIYNKSKPIPYIQINKVLSAYNVMIALGGGNTVKELQTAVFNGAKIVMVWRDFMQNSAGTKALVEEFLKVVK